MNMINATADVDTTTIYSNSTSNTSSFEADPENSTSDSLFVVILKLFMVLIILLGNSIIAVAIRKTTKMRQSTVRMVLHLASADFLLGLAFLVRIIVTSVTPIGKHSCIVILALIVTSSGTSMSGILMLCIDTYLCVQHMVISKHNLSIKTVNFMLAFTWFFWLSLGMGVLLLPDNDNGESKRCLVAGGYFDERYLVALTCIGHAHFIPIFILQIKTSLKLRSFKQEILSKGRIRGLDTGHKNQNVERSKGMRNYGNQGKESIGTGNQDNVNVSEDSYSSSNLTPIHTKWLKATSNISTIVTAILVLFIFTWFLLFIAILANFISPSKETAIAVVVLSPFGAINSMGNVFIFAYKNAEFRSIVTRFFKCRVSNAVGPSSP